MSDDVNGVSLAIIQLARVGLRVVLWLAIVAALLFGLFTYPLLVLVGFIPLYALVQYVRHERG